MAAIPVAINAVNIFLHSALELMLVFCHIEIDNINKVSLLSLSLAENLLSTVDVCLWVGLQQGDPGWVRAMAQIAYFQRCNYYVQMLYLTFERFFRTLLGIRYQLY